MFPDPSIVMEGAVNTTTQTLLEYSTFNTTLTTTEDLSKPMCEHKHDTVSHYYTFIGEAYVEPVMFFLGIVTNIVTFIVLYHMSLGKVIKLLLCALSVSDFMASFTAFVNILLEITLFHGEVTHGYWCRGMGVTLTTYYLFLMFISISAALVISLSIIRVYSLRKPFKSRTTLKIRFLVKVIVGIVVSMLILFLPVGFFIVWQLCYKNPLYPQCKAFFDRFPNAEMTEKYLYILSVLFGPLTVVGNLVCLLLLRGYIRKSTKQSIRMQYPADGEQHSTSQMKKSMRITRMLFFVLVINTICIMPTCIQFALVLINKDLVLEKDNVGFAIFDVIAEIFLGAVPCYNFWTYIIINKDFRRKFRKLCCCGNNELNSNDSTSSSAPARTQSTSNMSMSSKLNGARV